MSALSGIIENLDHRTFEVLEDGFKPLEDMNKAAANYIQKLNEVIQQYQETKKIPDLSLFESSQNFTDEKLAERAKERDSTKENIEPTLNSPPKKGRPRRNTRNESTQNERITRTRSRKPIVDDLMSLSVKAEKLSICINEEIPIDPPIAEQIKTEVEEMPPPSRPAPRKKTKRGRSKVEVKQEIIVKEEKQEEKQEEEQEEKREEEQEEKRDSDVLIEDEALIVIDLVDSFEENDETMTKEKETSQKKTKRSRSPSSEEGENSFGKRAKSNEENEKKDETSINYEDAISTVEESKEVNNATFIAKPSDESVVTLQQSHCNSRINIPLNLNATVVIENPRCVDKFCPISVNDMMTDDESEEEEKKKCSKPVRSIPKPIKQVFSPFEQSPVKKKVQAFERLKEEAEALPPRTTRTKTRAQTKQQEANDAATKDTEQKSNVKEKAKIFTPTATKFLPKAASTTSKNRALGASTNESLVSVKNASAMKATAAENREREKRRREKEEETLKKREAMLQAQTEEKKRKREEKQLKAQQQREALEKEKLKVLEAQKLKEERHKQLVAEQEEKKQKQREEQEKKRMMAKVKAIEEKKKEEEKKIEEQKKADEMTAKMAKRDQDIAKMLEKQKMKVPTYMKTDIPELPTKDCYDSDDENFGKSKILPDWTKENSVRCMMKYAFAAGEAIKNTFFSIQGQTPDLQDIFEVIESRKLKRTSSAVWHKPPRFTMLIGLDKYDEREECNEDS